MEVSYDLRGDYRNYVPRSLPWWESLGIEEEHRVILPKKSETIYDALLGFVCMYTHHFSLSNLRLPIPLFICDVLNYFKAYGGEPYVDLLQSFLNLGRAGDWLTLSNRGGADVPKALIKPITHLENWKGSFFYIDNKIIHSKSETSS
ncbi:hypothetical protein Tco_1452878 [Tanacetum coccineum]